MGRKETAEADLEDANLDAVWFLQRSTDVHEDINSIETHCRADSMEDLLKRLLQSRTGEVCARRTTLWTVALFGFAFLQSGIKDVILLSI
eukprot:g32108.t1